MDKHKKLKKKVLDWYQENKRSELPWRKNISFYNVHVSEIMLQQTQVSRVIEFFNKWIEKFPDYKTLAQANISEVYTYWKGLGYNSRAKRLWEAAKILQHEQEFKHVFEKHKKIAGIGPYTESAIETFVFHKKVQMIETNIRRVYIHEFFGEDMSGNIGDSQLFPLISETLEIIDDPRTWYWALMDYGSHLPKIIKNNPNKKSKHYVKQSKFEGSLRQMRAKILFYITEYGDKKITQQDILDEFKNDDTDYVLEALTALQKDALIEIKKYIKLL